jgi:hypothetical protein
MTNDRTREEHLRELAECRGFLLRASRHTKRRDNLYALISDTAGARQRATNYFRYSLTLDDVEAELQYLRARG